MMGLLRRNAANLAEDEGAEWARMRVHVVRNSVMNKLGYSSKLNAEWDFLSMLKDEGRMAAAEFLAAHGDDLGKTCTVDIDALLAEI
jgi:NTE family protein